MQKFLDDEAGYIQWTQTHPGGFVINAPRTGHTVAFMLHTARCRDITTDKRDHFTGPGYFKVCSEEQAELVAWANNQEGALQFCSRCKP